MSNVAVADFNGSIVINNTGTISGSVSLSSSTFNNLAGGTWKVNGPNFLGSAASIANTGTIAIYGLSSLNAVGIFALSNAGTINIQPNSAAFINANVSGGGTFAIGDRSSLELAGSVAAGQPTRVNDPFAAAGRGRADTRHSLCLPGDHGRPAPATDATSRTLASTPPLSCRA